MYPRINVIRSGCYPWLYLLTMYSGLQAIPDVNACPQAHATVDDFGNLVIVRGWA